VSAGAVGEHVKLLFFDVFFHVATGAVDALVLILGRGVLFRQVRNDDAAMRSFGHVFGLGDDAAHAAPGLGGAISKGGEYAAHL